MAMKTRRALSPKEELDALIASFPEPKATNRRPPNRIIEMVPIESVIPNDKPIKDHPDEKIDILVQSYDRFEEATPILVDRRMRIIDGEGRYKAAARMGKSEIAIIRVTHLSDEECDALRVALAESAKGSKDSKHLAPLVQHLLGQGYKGRDLGLNTPRLDQLLRSKYVSPRRADESAFIKPPERSVSRLGDIWLMGHHRLAHINSLDPSQLRTLMRGELAAAAIVDGPYGIDQSVLPGQRHHHPDFAMGGGQETPDQFATLCNGWMQAIHDNIQPGRNAYSFMSWHNLHVLTKAGADVGLLHKGTIAWVKPAGGNSGSTYRPRHEFVLFHQKPGGKATNNVRGGKYGRPRSDVWEYPGNSSFGADRDASLAAHPTQKPCKMIIDAVLDCTATGESVLDIFAGSGTLMLAAQACGRKALLAEMTGPYVDVTIARMKQTYGIDAILEGTDLTFDEVAEQRSAEGDASSPARSRRPRRERSRAKGVVQ